MYFNAILIWWAACRQHELIGNSVFPFVGDVEMKIVRNSEQSKVSDFFFFYQAYNVIIRSVFVVGLEKGAGWDCQQA